MSTVDEDISNKNEELIGLRLQWNKQKSSLTEAVNEAKKFVSFNSLLMKVH